MSTPGSRLTWVAFTAALLSACASGSGGAGPEADAAKAMPGTEAPKRTAAEARVERFFQDWERERSPIGKEERARLSAAQRAVYEIFEAVFAPDDLERFGEGYQDYGCGAPYWVVSGTITYTVVDRLQAPDRQLLDGTAALLPQETLEQATIKDFRPEVGSDASRPLYLHREHERALERFLRGKSFDAAASRICVAGTFQAGRWEVRTWPLLYDIELDQTLGEASVSWWIGSKAGEARLSKGEHGWDLVSSEMTVVE